MEKRFINEFVPLSVPLNQAASLPSTPRDTVRREIVRVVKHSWLGCVSLHSRSLKCIYMKQVRSALEPVPLRCEVNALIS